MYKTIPSNVYKLATSDEYNGKYVDSWIQVDLIKDITTPGVVQLSSFSYYPPVFVSSVALFPYFVIKFLIIFIKKN